MSPTYKPHFRVVFVVGKPGVGKSTLCKAAAQELGCFHLPIDEYIRHLASGAMGTHWAGSRADLTPQAMRDILERGDPLPDDQLAAILRNRIRREYYNTHCERFLIDGFPQTMASARAFEQAIGMPVMILELDCPRELSKQRFLSRDRDASDIPEKYEERYAQYEKESGRAISHYRHLHQKIGTDCYEQEVLKAMVNVLKRL